MKTLFISAFATLACAFLPMMTFASDQGLEISEEQELPVGDVQAQEEYDYNFGQVRVNRSATTSFTLRNRGGVPLYVQDIDISGVGFRKSDNCPRILARGNSCQIRVRFEPNTEGRYRGQLDINITPASDIRVNLRGRGIGRGGW